MSYKTTGGMYYFNNPNKNNFIINGKKGNTVFNSFEWVQIEKKDEISRKWVEFCINEKSYKASYTYFSNPVNINNYTTIEIDSASNPPSYVTSLSNYTYTIFDTKDAISKAWVNFCIKTGKLANPFDFRTIISDNPIISSTNTIPACTWNTTYAVYYYKVDIIIKDELAHKWTNFCYQEGLKQSL